MQQLRRGLLAHRGISTRARGSAAYLSEGSDHPSTSTSPSGLSASQRAALESAIRVDQAGEVAANWIYAGQSAVLGRSKTTGPIIQDMWEQEKRHLAVMNKIQAQHEVRPTILTDIAKVVGYSVGAATALMGKEAAMACTEAVETVIGEHYNDQLRELEALPIEHPSIPLLKEVISEFRDDELEHLDTAVENHSQDAPAHALLSAVIGAGCKVAIECCKRV